MSVRRRQNWLNQQRVDVPHLKSIESAVSSDFDELLTSFVLGESNSYVIRGFELNMSGAIGSAANSLQMIVAEGSIFHGASNESGTFFAVPSGTSNETLNSTTNERVDGAFTPSALNYIGLEYTRQVDNSTAAQVFLWTPTNTNEITKTLPLALTFDYKVVITSSIWASNVLPIAVVETDGSNNVLNVEDRRPLLFRLGTSGSNTPNPFYSYPWNNHSEGRLENPNTSSSSVSPFQGGDKMILNFKENDDAIKTSIKDIQGTTYWYSENVGGSILNLRSDIANTQMTGSGKFSHSATTPGQMNWDSDIYLNLVTSRLKYKISSNAATTDVVLADNQVAYINIVRGVNITPNLIFTNGSAIVTSVGAASWTTDVQAGDFVKIADQLDTHYYEILSVDSASQVTLTENFAETSTGTGGADSQYAWGTYQTDAAPSTDRHVQIADRKDVPLTANVYWLLLRADDGGAQAKVYLRGNSGGEIEQGEDREISDNQTLDVLEYIGSPAESDSTPDYTNSIVTAVAEVTTFTFPAASALADGESFNINSADDQYEYYVWMNKDGGGSNPYIPGRIGLEVPITGAMSAVQVAAAAHAVIDANGNFNSTDNLDGTITVTNANVGDTTNATNNDMGAGFSISVDTEGVGSPNRVVVDDENLTKTAKRLDEKVAELEDLLTAELYDEKILVVAASPGTGEILGPITAGTNITIPINTLNSIQQEYVVGSKTLEVYLGGDLLCAGAGNDYLEIGVSGDSSSTIQIQFQLEVGDRLRFKLGAGGAAGGGGGSSTGLNLGTAKDADVFKQVAGSQFQFRRLTAGANITITENAEDIQFSSTPGVAPSTVTAVNGVNYTAQSTDDVILVSNGGSDVTITLPTATSGKVFNIKKIDAGNTMFIKSVSGQTLDGVDIDATPHSITTQYENITIVSDGSNWFII